MRYLIDEMPHEPIDCPFCEPMPVLRDNAIQNDYICAKTGGECGRFTECPFPVETPYSCDGFVSVPGLITRPELREALAEAVRRS